MKLPSNYVWLLTVETEHPITGKITEEFKGIYADKKIAFRENPLLVFDSRYNEKALLHEAINWDKQNSKYVLKIQKVISQ